MSSASLIIAQDEPEVNETPENNGTQTATAEVPPDPPDGGDEFDTDSLYVDHLGDVCEYGTLVDRLFGLLAPHKVSGHGWDRGSFGGWARMQECVVCGNTSGDPE